MLVLRPQLSHQAARHTCRTLSCQLASNRGAADVPQGPRRPVAVENEDRRNPQLLRAFLSSVWHANTSKGQRLREMHVANLICVPELPCRECMVA